MVYSMVRQKKQNKQKTTTTWVRQIQEGLPLIRPATVLIGQAVTCHLFLRPAVKTVGKRSRNVGQS